MLEAMRPAFAAEAATEAPGRLVAIETNMGILPNYFFPEGSGRDYKASPYLERLAAHRDQMTVFSGTSFPGVTGGHAAERYFLTGTPHPERGGFRNGVSLDQFAADYVRSQTCTCRSCSGSELKSTNSRLAGERCADWRWCSMKFCSDLLASFVAITVFLASAQYSAAHSSEPDAAIGKFLSRYCIDCHGAASPAAALDLTSLPQEFANPEFSRRWVKIFDRISAGEMPPAKSVPLPDADRTAFTEQLRRAITEAEQVSPTAQLRRLSRSEYENTIRDLFDMPGIALAVNLPADGEYHGFNKLPEALDISHVNIAKYLEAADHILNYAIATRPEPPTISTRRISLVNRGGFVAHIVMNGDGVLLRDKRPDPEFPPAAEQNHLDQGAHERWGSFDNGASVGLFRHEDESVSPYFIEHVTIYPARYRVRTSLWSFQWDQGTLLPSRGTEAARLSVVQLTGDGRGGQHPSYVLGYFDAPDSNALKHEVYVWLNHNELIGFNTASLAPAANYYKARRAMEFTGPGITVDWLDIEGPLYESWPPQSHKVLFGELPIAEFNANDHPGVKPPVRTRPRQLGAGMNRPDPEPGVWTVQSQQQLADAHRLLGSFLPRLFCRPVADDVRQQYVAIVEERLAAGDCFELAMRAACRTALVAPDFLYHLDSADPNDQYALACRLSYFLWNSLPDDQLLVHAASGDLPQVLHAEAERLLQDPRSNRFINDFLGQWLKLDDIAANDPDRKLYPEFSPYLQDSMVAETRATFRELLDLDPEDYSKRHDHQPGAPRRVCDGPPAGRTTGTTAFKRGCDRTGCPRYHNHT